MIYTERKKKKNGYVEPKISTFKCRECTLHWNADLRSNRTYNCFDGWFSLVAHFHPVLRAVLVRKLQSVSEHYCFYCVVMHYRCADRANVDYLGTKQDSNVEFISACSGNPSKIGFLFKGMCRI